MKLAWMPWVGSLSFAVSAHAAVVISEINYTPPTDGQDTEFVEILNTGPGMVDISGWSWGGVTFTFPVGSTLAPHGVWVVAMELTDTGDANAESFEHYYGNGDGTADEFAYPVDDGSGGLTDAGEVVTLFDDGGVTVDSFDYTGLLGGSNTAGLTVERHSAAAGDFVAGSVAGGTPGFTEFSLVAVPEPASLLLVATPLWALPRWRRRKP